MICSDPSLKIRVDLFLQIVQPVMTDITPPLWIDKYAPSLEEITHNKVREILLASQDSAINYLIHGPPGIGKTATLKAFQHTSQKSKEDFSTLNAADFFELTKKELSNHSRFGQFITPQMKRDSSKASLFNYVLKEIAANKPVSSQYKTIVIDNGQHMRGDFQQALRRVIERHYETTRFILCTRSTSGIIDPIKSRFNPLPMKPPTHKETVSILERIAKKEELSFTPDGLEFIAGYSDGNIRQAITNLQLIAKEREEITHRSSYESLNNDIFVNEFTEIFQAVKDDEFETVREIIDELLITHGLSGEEVLYRLHKDFQKRLSEGQQQEITPITSSVDVNIQTGTNPRTHLMQYLTALQRIIQ